MRYANFGQIRNAAARQKQNTLDKTGRVIASSIIYEQLLQATLQSETADRN